MTNLLAVELGRFWSRRLFRVLVILAALGLIVAGVIALIVGDDSAEAVARAEAERELQVDACMQQFEGVEGLPEEIGDDPRGFCEEQAFVDDPRFPYIDMPDVLKGLSVPFLMIGWLIGASFVGAEWHQRTMTTMLTWEPRRTRLFVAKLIALVVGVAFVLLLLQMFVLLAFLPAGLSVGNMEGIDAGWWGDIFEQVVRTCGLGVFAASFGMSLAMIGRNTAAALGVGFVYFAIVENLIRAFRPAWSDWLVSDNIALVLLGNRSEIFGMDHSVTEGILLLAVYAAAVFLLALGFFKRRDLA